MKIGFIGFGNMAKAIANGCTKKNTLSNKDILFYDPYIINENYNKKETLQQLVSDSDVVFLCVKPNVIETVLLDLKKYINVKPLVSIAAGVTFDFIQSIINDGHIIRVMPNTCAMVESSYTCYNSNHTLNPQELDIVTQIFNSIGEFHQYEEKYFNICTSLCSCGVAFGYMLVESMADGGVLCGMNKQNAIKMANSAILGSCKMILENSQKTPTQLKDEVCSPGGMTVKAMKTLEDNNFRAGVINAIEAAYNKGNKLC